MSAASRSGTSRRGREQNLVRVAVGGQLLGLGQPLPVLRAERAVVGSAGGHEIDVYADDVPGSGGGQQPGDAGAPVAALRPVPVVAEFAHEGGPRLGDALLTPAALTGGPGEAEPR